MGSEKTFPLVIEGEYQTVPRRIFCNPKKVCGGELCLLIIPVVDDDKAEALLAFLKGREVHIWRNWTSDAPTKPSAPVGLSEAKAEIREKLDKTLPKSPTVFRGKWSGHLACNNETPEVHLYRQITTYLNLHVWSSDGRWHAEAIPKEKWFVREGGITSLNVGLGKRLSTAITIALNAAVNGPAAQACSVRDTVREGTVNVNKLLPVEKTRAFNVGLKEVAEKPVRAPRLPKVAGPVAEKPASRASKSKALPTPPPSDDPQRQRIRAGLERQEAAFNPSGIDPKVIVRTDGDGKSSGGASPKELVEAANYIARTTGDKNGPQISWGDVDSVVAWLKWEDRDGEFDYLRTASWQEAIGALEDISADWVEEAQASKDAIDYGVHDHQKAMQLWKAQKPASRFPMRHIVEHYGLDQPRSDDDEPCDKCKDAAPKLYMVEYRKTPRGGWIDSSKKWAQSVGQAQVDSEAGALATAGGWVAYRIVLDGDVVKGSERKMDVAGTADAPAPKSTAPKRNNKAADKQAMLEFLKAGIAQAAQDL